MKLAVLGDFHIPGRAEKIPEEFIEILKNKEFDKILCTGDLTDISVYDELCKFGDVECVLGNMDSSLKFPNEKTFTFGKYIVGLVHGRGIHPRGDEEQLLEIANSLQVDILIHGHTHKQEIKRVQNKLLINPGSVTGVWGGGNADEIPGFVILELNEKIEVRSFQLIGGKLEKNVEEFNLKAT